jgi:hypothetical protein
VHDCGCAISALAICFFKKNTEFSNCEKRMALQVGDEAEEALKRKIRGAFSVFDKDSHNTCDVREVRGGLFA